MEFAELIATPKLDGVVLHSQLHGPVDGTLCITGHHLILSSRKQGAQELWLLHQNIDCVEKRPTPSSTSTPKSLVLKCKDLRIISLEISPVEDLLKVCASIEALSSLAHPSALYPFFYRPIFTALEDGHALFKPEFEFAKLVAGEEWRVSSVNRAYAVCPSYPAVVVVPRAVDDETIAAAAAFREGGRFPVVSYRHEETGAVLARGAQPLAGPSNKRCRPDERLLNSLLGPGMRKGYIVDTRSAALAAQSRTRGGGGTEADSHYPQWKRIHRAMDKISSGLQESFSRLVEACNDTAASSDRWLNRLEASNWLGHVQTALNTACVVAQCLHQEAASVMVHGGAGLDATLLVTALAQVILSPDSRSVRGLQALVEREWLQAGHPFGQRMARGCYAASQKGVKTAQPTFALFLDCVHQLHRQFSASFEFSPRLLVLLFDHSYASQFGTFLGDSEAHRRALGVPTATTSLWSHLNRPEVLCSLLNPLYEPNRAPIWPSVAPVSLALWRDLFLRHVFDARQQALRCARLQEVVQDDKDLRSRVARMRKQLVDLQKELDTMTMAEQEQEEEGAD